MKELIVEAVTNYGQLMYKPVCRDARTFTRLIGTTNISKEAVIDIKRLGYVVALKAQKKELVEDHNGEWSLDELGVCRDTVIIEIEGGVLKEVHNTPNDYILFDWDNIKEEGETTNKQGELLLILETLEKEI